MASDSVTEAAAGEHELLRTPVQEVLNRLKASDFDVETTGNALLYNVAMELLEAKQEIANLKEEIQKSKTSVVFEEEDDDITWKQLQEVYGKVKRQRIELHLPDVRLISSCYSTINVEVRNGKNGTEKSLFTRAKRRPLTDSRFSSI
jgi:hypothetical protein